MKQRKTMKAWCLHIMLIILLIGATPQTILAYDFVTELTEAGKWVYINDEWRWVDIDRSLHTISPTSYINGNTLFIENLKVEQSVTISIKDSYGQIVVEEIQQLCSSSVSISLDSLVDGEYTLELNSSKGRYFVNFQSIN